MPKGTPMGLAVLISQKAADKKKKSAKDDQKGSRLEAFKEFRAALKKGDDEAALEALDALSALAD